MGHVVDEIILYLTQLLLPESENDSINKDCHQQKCEGKRWQHEFDGGEDIVALSGKHHIESGIVAVGIVGKENLRIDSSFLFDTLIISRSAVGHCCRRIYNGKFKWLSRKNRSI